MNFARRGFSFWHKFQILWKFAISKYILFMKYIISWIRGWNWKSGTDLICSEIFRLSTVSSINRIVRSSIVSFLPFEGILLPLNLDHWESTVDRIQRVYILDFNRVALKIKIINCYFALSFHTWSLIKAIYRVRKHKV